MPESEAADKAKVIEALPPFRQNQLLVARVADEAKWSGEREHGHDVGGELSMSRQYAKHLFESKGELTRTYQRDIPKTGLAYVSGKVNYGTIGQLVQSKTPRGNPVVRVTLLPIYTYCLSSLAKLSHLRNKQVDMIIDLRLP